MTTRESIQVVINFHISEPSKRNIQKNRRGYTSSIFSLLSSGTISRASQIIFTHYLTDEYLLCIY
jgi:hypothetical protein